MKGLLLFLVLIVCAKSDFAQTFNKTYLFGFTAFYLENIYFDRESEEIITSGYSAKIQSPSQAEVIINKLSLVGKVKKTTILYDSLDHMKFTQAANGICKIGLH